MSEAEIPTAAAVTQAAAGSWPHLSRAPIVEALIDFRIDPHPDTSVATFEAFGQNIRADYPDRHERVAFSLSGRLPVGGPGPSEMRSSSQPDGLVFRSGDGLQIAQAQLAGFTFSRLAPYGTWNELRTEARRLWSLYVARARPTRVTRIGVRFVNRLVLAVPVDYAQYIQTLPTIAPQLPQEVQELVMRLVIPFPRHEARCIITQVIEPIDAMGHAPYVFDIDAFREGAWSPDAAQLWEATDGLREVKNTVFFNSLTERALEMLR